MPPLPTDERWAARLTGWASGCSTLAVAGHHVDLFARRCADDGTLAVHWSALAIFDRVRGKITTARREVASYKPQVAVLIPAYNEEKVIERTVRAVLALGLSQPARDCD